MQLSEGNWGGARYHLLRGGANTPLEPYRTASAHGQPLSQMDRFCQAEASLNGTFFDMSDPRQVFGEVKNSSENYRPAMSKMRTWVGRTHQGTLEMGETVKDANGRWSMPRAQWDRFEMVLGGGGRLLHEGHPVSVGAGVNDEQFQGDILARRNRSAVGFNDHEVFLVACDNPGWTPQETAAFLQSKGASEALFLDGGGSTEMLVNHQRVTPLSAGAERLLPTALVVKAS